MRRLRTIRLFQPWLLPLLIVAPLCRASTSSKGWSPFREIQAPITVFHHAEINNLRAAGCQDSEPPEALATPDPLLDSADSDNKVAVSFIVGTDGRVHSPVILESAGSEEDGRVLQALRIWRYRPGTCNAVPAEIESKVEFSTH